MICAFLTVALVAISIKCGILTFHYNLFRYIGRLLRSCFTAALCIIEFRCFEFKTNFNAQFGHVFTTENRIYDGFTSTLDNVCNEQIVYRHTHDLNEELTIGKQRVQCSKTWSTTDDNKQMSENIPHSTPENNLTMINSQKTSLLGNINISMVGNVSEFLSIFGRNAHHMLMEKYKKYGPIYTFSAFGQKMVFLFEVEDVKALMDSEGRCPVHVDFKHLRRHRENKGFPKGLLVSEGDEWHRQRKLLSSPFMFRTGHNVKVIDETVKETVSRIVNSDLRRTESMFNVESITRDFAINAFGSILFGSAFETTFTENGKIMKRFAEMAKDNFKDAKKLLMTPEWLMKMHPAWNRHNKRWDFLLKTIIETIQRRTTADDSILACLLNKGQLTDKEVYINMTDLLVASIDTTNTVLQWCLYELARHPDVQEKINEEAKNFLQDNGCLEKSDLDKLVLLKAVVWETFRLHPVGFFTSRIVQKEMIVRGVTIPTKTNVAISMYVMCRNPHIFPEPDCFIPTRWLSKDPQLKKFPHRVFFGFGPRMCLGKKIAELEIMIFLLRFCMEFDFWTDDKTIGHTVKLLLSPSRPVEIGVRRRSP